MPTNVNEFLQWLLNRLEAVEVVEFTYGGTRILNGIVKHLVKGSNQSLDKIKLLLMDKTIYASSAGVILLVIIFSSPKEREELLEIFGANHWSCPQIVITHYIWSKGFYGAGTRKLVDVFGQTNIKILYSPDGQSIASFKPETLVVDAILDSTRWIPTRSTPFRDAGWVFKAGAFRQLFTRPALLIGSITSVPLIHHSSTNVWALV